MQRQLPLFAPRALTRAPHHHPQTDTISKSHLHNIFFFTLHLCLYLHTNTRTSLSLLALLSLSSLALYSVDCGRRTKLESASKVLLISGRVTSFSFRIEFFCDNFSIRFFHYYICIYNSFFLRLQRAERTDIYFLSR